MFSHKRYSHTDIKQYLEQRMSRGEMHAFENAMMDDPMLCDAVDGFRAADWQQTNEHLITIEHKLTQKKNEAEIIPFPSKKTSWWRVAAIVAVIVTGGVLSYSLLRQPAINQESATQLATSKAPQPTIENDSVKSDEKPLVYSEKETIENNKGENKTQLNPPVISKEEVPLASLNDEKIKNEINNSPSPSPHPNLQKRLSPGQVNTAAADISANAGTFDMAKPSAMQAKEYNGKVVNTNGEPLAGASVKIADKDIATATDDNGKFKLKSTDSIVKVDVNSVGYASANTRLNRNDGDNKIVLKENSQTLSEVVVTTTETKRKKNLSFNTAKVSAPDLKPHTQPLNGMAAYMQYVQKQADSTLQADGKKPVGITVSVEFSVNKKGKPTHLKVSGTEDRYYRKKAIHIVENGPLWSQSEWANGKVLVSF